MPDRRTELADAALAVVAAKGLKGLTHRAVDAEAGAAVGTTSNYFRNREALVTAALDRVEELDSRLLRQQARGQFPTSVSELAEQLTGAVLALAREHADLTRARFAFALDRPESVSAGHERMLTGLAQILEALGVPDSRVRAEAVADYSDGLALHLLTARQGQDIAHSTVAANVRQLLEG
ncbi:TetR/AcrR family transcriptional regulator [Paenarthrobacter sp. NPDC089714]|uniref:TetR/AcrR family transcriptional regulator n=1 Tax=Paenarthrobacter sp. NPDC089714 TaxID=3364377 RepID=UPI003808C0AF